MWEKREEGGKGRRSGFGKGEEGGGGGYYGEDDGGSGRGVG